jgi:hypothetical protein
LTAAKARNESASAKIQRQDSMRCIDVILDSRSIIISGDASTEVTSYGDFQSIAFR